MHAQRGRISILLLAAASAAAFGAFNGAEAGVITWAGNTWQDFISVSAMNGGGAVGVTYNRGDTTNQQLSTQHGMAGVLGIGDVNKTDADDTGNVGFTFASAVTSLRITFLDGPGGASAVQHHIMMQNLTITPVPEASSVVFGGLGLGRFGAYRCLETR